jgi:hypothetical protein
MEDNIFEALKAEVVTPCMRKSCSASSYLGVPRILSADIPQEKSTIGKKLWVSFLLNDRVSCEYNQLHL